MPEHLVRMYYKAEVFLKEKNDYGDPFLSANFLKVEDAEFAILWAFETRLEELRNRNNVAEITFSNHRSDYKRITWWQSRTPWEYFVQKDYFSMTPMELNLVLL